MFMIMLWFFIDEWDHCSPAGGHNSRASVEKGVKSAISSEKVSLQPEADDLRTTRLEI